jgi:hypothetical protein
MLPKGILLNFPANLKGEGHATLALLMVSSSFATAVKALHTLDKSVNS